MPPAGAPWEMEATRKRISPLRLMMMSFTCPETSPASLRIATFKPSLTR